MGRINVLFAVCCLAVGLSVASCSKEGAGSTEQGQTARFSAPVDAIADAAVPAGTTYRIMAFNAEDNLNRYKFSQSGTYYLKNADDEELTPCDLDADGAYLNDSESGGMNGANGSFFMVFVSPGVQHNDATGTFSFTPATEQFMATAPESKSLGGYGLIRMQNKLKDQRVKVGMKFYKLEDPEIPVDDFEVAALKLEGAGATGQPVELYPASRQVVVGSDQAIDVALIPKDGTEKDDAGNSLYYTTDADNPIYIASAIYAPTSEVAEILNTRYSTNLPGSDYIYMTCLLSQGERRNIPIRMPLTSTIRELLPQHSYQFIITVKSNYISATVEVFEFGNSNDWEDGGKESGIIDTPKFTVKLGTWKIVGDGNDWELEEVAGQIIGGSTV